jgi:hypothetical protein
MVLLLCPIHWRWQRLSERHFLIPLASRRHVDVLLSILVRARNRFRFFTVTYNDPHCTNDFTAILKIYVLNYDKHTKRV